MAEIAVSRALQVLETLLIQKPYFLGGVEEEALSLKHDLQSLLRGVRVKNVMMIEMWRQIRDLALRAEDAVEISVFKVRDASRERLRRCVCLPSHLKDASAEKQRLMKEIRSVREIARYILDHPQSVIQQDQTEPPSSSRRRRDGVRRPRRRLARGEDDEEANFLLQKLGESDKALSVAIVGMGGIGKSALADKVYNHPGIADRFECRARALISQVFTKEDVLKEIMVQLKIPAVPDNMLRETLHKHLENKRCFIVLDDVWDRGLLESLTSIFQGTECRLLVTSRIRDVAADAQYVHEMRLLTQEESWELFSKIAFINGRCPEELVEIGRAIVRMCRGLPLAIYLVGGLLWAENKSTMAWKNVFQQIQSYVTRDEIVLLILELIYHNMPLHLKSCFLYLPSFRDNAPIPVKRLIQVWIAHDLVLQDEGQETVEDVARGYLDELIDRNLVQIEDMTADGRVKTCKVHDIVRELSVYKAKDEINFEILGEGASSDSAHNARHCAMYCSEESFRGLPTDQNDHLRSLFVHKMEEGGSLYPPSSFWRSFKLLKVLDMEDCGLRKLPDTIGTLFLLRYLGLRNTYINELPESMSKLEYLQVLDSRGGYLILPAFIWTMRSLRHLNSSEIWLSQPVEKCTVENLQTLGDLVLEDDRMMEQLKQMTGLTKLGIILWSISDVRKLFESLAMLQNLSSLSLKSYFTLTLDGLGTLRRITKLKLEGHIDKLPSAGDFPPNLSYLTLNRTALRVDPMPVLGELPLLSLKLDYEAYRGEKMEILHDGFPRLQSIILRGLGNLKNINVGKGAMPELQQQWDVKECPNLSIENIPRSAVSGTQ